MPLDVPISSSGPAADGVDPAHGSEGTAEARFRNLADAAPALLWVSEPDGSCTFLSQGWYAYTGQTEEEALGYGWTEAVHPDDREDTRAAFLAANAQQRPFHIDYRLRRHDGIYRWAIDAGQPRFDADGTYLGYVGSVIDIHDRKHAETRAQLLAETGRLIEQAFDYEATLAEIARVAVPDFADWCAVDLLQDDGAICAVAIAHADPEKVAWGWELREQYPVVADAPTGVPHVIREGEAELYPAISDEMLVAAARDEDHLRIMQRVGFNSVVIVPMRAGEDVIGAVTFVYAESGRHFDEADLATAKEIGRRAGIAIETARLHRAMSESEARFRNLAEALPDIVYTSNAEGRVDYLNARWFEYTGQPPDTDPLTAVEVVHPDDAARVAEEWEAARTGGETFEAELRLRRHDGVYRWFLTRVVPVEDAEGRITRWFATTTDIHAQKAAEAELAERVTKRTAELERSNAELDQFAYVASHDLRAPLRGIDNLAAWIVEDAADLLPEESERHLGLLRGRVQRMEHLLDDLLAYSRLARLEGGPESLDTDCLVRDVVDLLDPPPGFEVVVQEPMPPVTSAQAPLEMVFRNLIANALKHHNDDEGRIVITAEDAASDDPPGHVAFSVADDGPGIDSAYHDRIFGLFQTLRPRDEVEGSGMGLALVRKAVEGRGGRITVRSEPGHGAIFRFTWPKEP